MHKNAVHIFLSSFYYLAVYNKKFTSIYNIYIFNHNFQSTYFCIYRLLINRHLECQWNKILLQDTSQLTPLASPSPGSRTTFAAPPLKINRSGLTPQNPHQGMVRLPNQSCPIARATPGVVRSGFPQPPSPFSPQAPQSPHDFPQSPVSSQTPEQQQQQQQQQQQNFQQRFEGGGEGFSPRGPAPSSSPYSTSSPQHAAVPQPSGATTPRAVFNPPAPSARPTPVYAPPPSLTPPSSRTPDPYGVVAARQPPPATPVSVASAVYPPRGPEASRGAGGQEQEAFGQQPEVNHQLRDLLQRQQFSKKIEAVGSSWTQDSQNNSESSQQQFDTSHPQLPQHSQVSGNEGTFRHPLPPAIVRSRMPVQSNVLIKKPIASNIDARLQGIDHRTRMLLQRPQLAAAVSQHFQGAQALQTRLPAARNAISEPYDILQQQRYPGKLTSSYILYLCRFSFDFYLRFNFIHHIFYFYFSF